MALFQSYAPPGVYTSVIIQPSGAPLFGSARIPVIIGEGVENFVFDNIEIFRGSSASADDQAVNEDISAQVTGLTRTFQTTYFPVTDGSGNGVVTNDYTKIQVTADGIPVTVVSLVGATGVFMTQQIIPTGTSLLVTYFFKRTDTLQTNENLTPQVPQYASTIIFDHINAANFLTVKASTPGSLGTPSEVTVTLVNNGVGSTDALAVTGSGSNTISINILKADNVTVRTLTNILALFTAGIPTALAGYLNAVLTGVGTGTPSAQALTLTGGIGPNTNTTFKTAHTPIVDGTNGGIVTTNPADVTVLVNGVAATVSAVDGANGLVTLANPVAFGSTVTITYFWNMWQNTFDLLPANNIVQIDEVGLGPNRADFTNNVDYVLSNNKIYWGAAYIVEPGSTTAGSTAFGPLQITPTLIDEHVYLVPASGAANGLNTVFTSEFVPVDGSGLSRATDNPTLISVYVGPDPVTALNSGAVPVARLSGASGTITLYNPPALNQGVYVSGYRSILTDNVYTLEVENPGIPGQGTYSITDQLGRNVPATTIGTNVVTQSGPFAITGIVWPNQVPDFEAAIGGATETITLTFQQDGYTYITVPATQASATATIAAASVTVSATTAGTVPNGTSLTFLAGPAGTTDILSVYSSLGTFAGGVTTPFPSWQANHVYTLGQMIYDPTSASLQVVTSAGTSGPTSPSFSATPGVTTPDGSPPDMIWTSNGTAPTSAETVYVNIDSTTGVRTVAQILTLVTNSGASTPHAGVINISATGTTSGNATAHVFTLTGGTNATTAPASDRFLVSSSRTATQASTDHLGRTGNGTTPSYPNFATNLWTAFTAYSLNQTVVDTNGNIQRVTTAGTTGATQPVWATSGTTTDGSVSPFTAVIWTFVGPLVGTSNYLGETYIDTNTAVKFTIVDPLKALLYGYVSLPNPTYQYEPGDTLQLVVTDPGVFVTGTTPIIAMPGIKTVVQTTLGMASGNTATVQTFNKSGNNPNVGEFYYVSFETAKQPSDFAIQLYENAATAYAVYGTPNTTNRVSLGVQLLTQNGAQQFGVVQVPKQAGQPVASDQAFIDAIQSLAAALPGTDLFAAVIVPLTSSPTVQSFLSRFLITQASPRIQAEGIGFIGYSQYETTSQARQSAMGLLNSRIIAVAPFVAGILIDPSNGTGAAVEYAVDGPFLAAALAGLEVNPANDVATTLTNQQVVGFSRLLGPKLDDPTMDLMAASGLTLLVEKGGSLNVRHYKSTDPSNVITSEPTATTVTDYVRQQFRTALDQFIGRKFVGTLVNDVTAVCNSLLRLLVNQEIIAGYKNLTVTPDPTDPTLLNITVSFQPVFALLYISVTFTVTTNL